MTTFEDAARAEAERKYPALPADRGEPVYPRSALREYRRLSYIEGWTDARAHLAEQEASDAEVLAAARALWERISPALAWDDATEAYRDACRMDARAALRAAARIRKEQGR